MPTISINSITGDDKVNVAEGLAGFAIAGLTTGVPDGRVVSVHILDAANAVVDTLFATVKNNGWTGQLSGTQAAMLANGSYTVTADVSDQLGTAAPQATRALAVDVLAPEVVSIVRTGSQSTNAAFVDYHVTFSEPVTGVTVDSFALDTTGVIGASVVQVTGSGTDYTVTAISGFGEGTVTLVATGAGVKDLAGNGLAGAEFQEPAVGYATGSAPEVVAIGDFNGDGKPDLAAANAASFNVSVLLNNGNGTFHTQSVILTGGADFVAIGDINLDGRPDLVVANGSANNVSILLGNGDGTFQPQPTVNAGTRPTSIAIEDFNKDGKPDLAVGNIQSDNVSILLGNGNGSFQAQTPYQVGDTPRRIAVGDLNRDGIADLAVTNGNDDSVSVLLGNGNGTFASEVRYAVGVSPVAIAIGDVNLDGRPDLVVTNAGGLFGPPPSSLSVLLGNGDGTFQPHSDFTAGSVPTSVAIADLDGDGNPDLVVANDLSDDISFLPGNGAGAFLGQITFPADGPRSVAVGDLNFDGKPDIAFTNSGGNSVAVLLNAPTPVTGETYTIDRTGPIAADDMAAVDEDASTTGNVIAGQQGGAGRDTEPTNQTIGVTRFSGPNGPGTVGQPLIGILGTLTIQPNGDYTYVADQAAADALAANVVASETFHYTVSDRAGNTDSADLVVTVTGVNDAPVLTDANLVLTAEPESSGAPVNGTAVGTPVAALVGVGNVTDADADALRGIAVTAADTQGSWFYSTDGGATWLALGSVAENSARLLAADAATRIYFQPDLTFNGTIVAALTFHAWDQTFGTNGGSADLTQTGTGGTTAFSAATDTAALTITGVNDPPSFTKGADQKVDEDSGPHSVVGWASSILAGPPNEAGQTVQFKVVNNTDASLFSAGPAIGSDGTLTYTPATNANGTATITVVAQDNGGTLNGGQDTSPAQTFQITIDAVNDAPVATIALASYAATEQVSLDLKNTGISVSDVDAVAAPGGIETATLSVTEGILNVSAGFSGVVVGNSGTGSITLQGTIAQINDLLNTNAASSVSYIDPSDAPSATATLTLSIHDSGNTGSGIDLFASASAIINIAPVNDAPVLDDVATDAIFRAHGQPVVVAPDLIISDIDSTHLVGATVKVTGGTFPGDGDHLGVGFLTPNITGIYDPSQETLTFSGNDTLANYQQVLRSITFESTASNLTNSGANLTRTITWQLDDGGTVDNLSAVDSTIVHLRPAPVADFDNDGHSDLLWRQNDGLTAIWQMNGTQIANASSLGVIGPNWHALDRGDFDGDGNADILWRNDDGTTAIWEMNGTQIKAGIQLPFVGPSWQVQPLGDFDADGKTDILWRDEQTGQTALWEMNGGQIKAGISLGVIGAGWHVAAVADFDGDAKSDILWRDDSGQTALWEMDGGRIKIGIELASLGPSWQVAGTGDFDGDGNADILWREASGLTALWEMDGGHIRHVDNLGVISPNLHVATIADFDGNGTSDLLWRNDNGQTALWEMNGAQATAAVDFGTIGTAWHVVSDHLV